MTIQQTIAKLSEMEAFFKGCSDYEMYCECLNAKRKLLDSIMYLNDKNKRL